MFSPVIKLPFTNSAFYKTLTESQKESRLDKYCLFFDGCSKGNPGQGGAGAVLYKNDDEMWADSTFVGKNVTNNASEYTGLILGMKKAINEGIKTITVKGDSQLVIKQMKGEYKVNSSNLEELYKTAKTLENSFDKIQYEHVYRKDNKRADELSNQGLQHCPPV
jgi:ribonuclease HI